MKPIEQVRQGDVFVQRCRKPVGELVEVASDGGRVVLAYGEVTGHSHQLPASAAVLFSHASGERYLRVLKRTELRHEEHAPIELKPGLYRTWIQREYTPEEIRNVAD